MDPVLKMLCTDDIDGLVQKYQTNNIVFDKHMLVIALNCNAYKIAELILMSGIGLSTNKNIYPENIQKMLAKYKESILEYASIENLTNELEWLATTDEKDDFPEYRKLLYEKVYNSLYDNYIVPHEQFSKEELIKIIDKKLYIELDIVELKWSFYADIKMSLTYKKLDIKTLINECDSIICINSPNEHKFTNYQPGNYIYARHGIPALIKAYSRNTGIDTHNKHTYKYITKRSDFLIDSWVSHMPQFRKHYYGILIKLEND